MIRRAAPRALVVEARAKLNLGLAVGPRRPDGYHELATIFQSVSLADTVRLERARGFSLSVRSAPGAPASAAAGVPRGGANLVLAAARAIERASGIPGARIRLLKRIPAGTGLGGASADAAATIAGLARLYGLGLTRARRMEIALTLGSDVPFALQGGTALGLGRGERLRRLHLERPFRAVIAVPRWRVSTARAYRRIDRAKYGLTAWGANLRFAQALGRVRLTALAGQKLGNTFELALGHRRDDLASLRERLSAAGLLAPRMTGSGSAVYAIVPAGKSAKLLLSRFVGDERLYLVRSASTGARIAVA